MRGTLGFSVLRFWLFYFFVNLVAICHIKRGGMLVVSPGGVNFGFWSHLGCLGKMQSYVAVKVSFRVAREEI